MSEKSSKDALTYQHIQLVFKVNHIIPMTLQAINVLSTLRPELWDELGVKKNLAWLEKVYLNPYEHEYKETELKIVRIVTALYPHLTIGAEELDFSQF